VINQSIQHCAAMVGYGFSPVNDPKGGFAFIQDDIEIFYRNHEWWITDPETDPLNYSDLLDLVLAESYRWEEE